MGLSFYSLCCLLFDIFVGVFSLAIAYYLYRSNKKMYRKIAVMNVLFLSILFLIQYVLPLVPYLLPDFYYNSHLSSDFIEFFGIFLLRFAIPALPSIFTIWYANKNKSEMYLILLLSLGIIFITIATLIFIDLANEIRYIRSQIAIADIYGHDKPYGRLAYMELIKIFSFISIIIGVILMAIGSTKLLKPKLNNN